MTNEMFEQAKKLKEQYDRLYEYRKKLFHAKGCGLNKAYLEFTVGPFNTPCDVYFKNLGLIREAIEKEIELVTVELDELQKQFDNL
jgi:hypothetical protein